MKVHLPHGAFLGNIDQFLAGFDPSNPNELEITAVDDWMWLHPVVLSMIAALSVDINKDQIKCQKITAKSGHYLERMGLFGFLGTNSGMSIQEHDPSGRFVPLRQIKTSDELTQFITDMIPMLHLEPKQVDPIRYTVSELVRNVLEHARTPNGAMVCAQYFKKSNSIRLGIADTGIGIRESLRRYYPTDADIDAIKLALFPGVTGTTMRGGGTEQNAGAGLFFIKSIAYINRDFFVIYSGNSMFKLLKREDSGELRLHANANLDRHSQNVTLSRWPGTVIGIDMSLDSTTEFNLLLDLIRDTYSEAVKEKKKERYRLPKFT